MCERERDEGRLGVGRVKETFLFYVHVCTYVCVRVSLFGDFTMLVDRLFNTNYATSWVSRE